MLWSWVVVPLLPSLLREQGELAARMPRRALIGRLACGFAWFAGVRGALRSLGEAAACAIYHDVGGMLLRAGSATICVNSGCCRPERDANIGGAGCLMPGNHGPASGELAPTATARPL